MKRRSMLFVLAAALLGGSLTLHPPAARADVVISVQLAPPALPVYSQPPCPGPGYIWTPGYWGWSPDAAAYYWVPGTWVQPPQIGYLWTPGYWGWSDGFYVWHPGFWAQQVGFYGGIHYGFGYPGNGFYGGYWRNRQFFYNRAVNNVNVTVVRNVYVRRVVVVDRGPRVSYNGGRGGVIARPRHEAGVRGPHFRAVAAQRQQRDLAQRDRGQFFGHGHARPAVYATPRPGAFRDRHAVRAPRARRPVLPQRSGDVRPTPGRPQVHREHRNPLPHPQRPLVRHTPAQRTVPGGRRTDRPAPQPRSTARQVQHRPAPAPRQMTRPAPHPAQARHPVQRQQPRPHPVRPARHAPPPRPRHPPPAAHRPPAHEPRHPQR